MLSRNDYLGHKACTTHSTAYFALFKPKCTDRISVYIKCHCITTDHNSTWSCLLCCSHLLLSSISKNIFKTIVDHAPYAIEDLMRELQHKEGDDSDSDQASGEEEEGIGEEDELKNKAKVNTKVKVNGKSRVYSLD